MTISIQLSNLHHRHYGLTPSIGNSYVEAARVCLDRHHKSPIQVTVIDCDRDHQAHLVWTATDERVRAAWANEIDTTEAGAYGCVIAGLEAVRNMFAVRRAETGSGADYYVAPEGADIQDLEECYRLEISGVDHGTKNDVRRRLVIKIQQARNGLSSLPAIAGVMGFSPKTLMIQDVVEE